MNTTHATPRNTRRDRQWMSTPCLLTVLLSFPMLAFGVDLVGAVRKNNVEAAGVTVKLRPEKPPAGGPERTVTSDNMGRFVVTNLIPGDYMLSCGGAETPIHVDYASNRVICTY